MNYDALRAELDGAAYSGTNAATAAVAINAKTVQVPAVVPASVVRGVLYARGRWAGVVRKANAARANADDTAAAIVCQVIYDLAASGAEIGMGDLSTASRVSDDLASLVVGGVLDEDDVAALMQLASRTVNWAELHLGSAVTDHDVDVARQV